MSTSFWLDFSCSTLSFTCPIHCKSLIFHSSSSLFHKCWDKVRWSHLKNGNRIACTMARRHIYPLTRSSLLNSSLSSWSSTNILVIECMYNFPLFHFSCVNVDLFLLFLVSNKQPAYGPLSMRRFLRISCKPRNSNLDAIHLVILQALVFNNNNTIETITIIFILVNIDLFCQLI